MQFADYQAFRVALQWLIEGDELTGTFSVNTLDLIIGLGEARVYHGDAMTAGLRASTMVTPLSQAVTANAATLPDDLLELKELYFTGERPVEIVGLEQVRAYEADGQSAGNSRYAAQDGETLRFWPTASGLALGRYYARPAPLVEELNTTFARYPELFIYASLYEAALFLGMDSKSPIWEARYRQLADGANHSERMRAFGGSRLRQRAR